PVKNKKGTALGEIAGRATTLVTFLEGLSIRRPNPSHCEALGGALADLHKAGDGFSLRRENALGHASWSGLAQSVPGRADQIMLGLSKLIEEEGTALEKAWPSDLPAGVIHADLFPDNVFFLSDKLSGLIDFYFACNDLLAYDIAVSLNAWCFEIDGSFNVTKGRALLSGYNNVRKLAPKEIAALPLLARGAALRFLLTRTIDWLNVPPGALVRPKDPLEYQKKLNFHRSIKNASEYGLIA